MHRIISFLCALLIAESVHGQDILETNPASVKWMRLTSPHFNILYPEGADTQAQRMAGTLERLYKPESKTLGTPPRRITIVMQSHSTESNAFVSLTPRRSEFYMMPPQDYNFTGNTEWMEMIASHEFRHVVQYDHADRGFNRFVHVLFGNATLSALASTAVPGWFWEGDAVVTETAYLPTGRGTIPNFGLVFRTNLLENRTFNYHKQWLRSYKHNITDQYVLGFHMVSYLRKRTGDPEIWGKITEQAWKNSIVPFTFSSAIHKQTGLHVTELYREMAADLKKEWSAWTDTLTLSVSEPINERRSSAYTDYLYPHELPDGRILAMKAGIGDIEQLISFKEMDEKKVHVMGMVNHTGMIDVKGKYVAWNEHRYDPRWRARNYSVVCVMDAESGTRWRVGSANTRYAGAGLSPDGQHVATVQTDNQFNHNLVVLSVKDGTVLRSYDNPDNAQFTMPRFSSDGTSIVALKVSAGKKSVVALDAAGSSEKELIPASAENIGYPVLHGSWLLFNSPVSGIDNIYAMNLQDGTRYQVTNSRYGAYNPSLSVNGDFIYFNDQNKNGMDVERIPFDPSTWKLSVPSVQQGMTLASEIRSQEAAVDLKGAGSENYPVARHHKLSGIVNPYGWGPMYANSYSQVDIGVISKDILSTTSLSAGYLFDIYERTGVFHGDISYQGWYPVVRGGISYGKRTDENVVFGTEADFSWNETGAYAGLQLPLLLTRSKYRTELRVSNDVGITLTSDFESRVTPEGGSTTIGNDRLVLVNDTLSYLFSDITNYGRLLYNHFNVGFSNTLKTSRRDFNPRFGQYLLFDSYTTPFGGDYTGWQWALRGFLMFPGLAKHHSIDLRASYQQAPDTYDLDQYRFRNSIAKPRGYKYPYHSQFVTLSANYALPVWYPDIAAGPLLNIQRIRMNLFYDYGEGRGAFYLYDFFDNPPTVGRYPNNEKYQSVGIELFADVNLFRLLPQFEFGYRFTRTIPVDGSPGAWVFEFMGVGIPF